MNGFIDMADYEMRPTRSRGSSNAGAFYRSALRDGMTIDEVAEEENSTIRDIRRALRASGYDPYEFLTLRERWVKFLAGPICQGQNADIADILQIPPQTIANVRRRALHL